MHIFISYRSVDRLLVETLGNDLRGLGHTVWFDQELTGGHAWWNSILQNVRESDLFIFALSPQSLDSYPCQLEYSYADTLGKRILPVLLKDINADLLPPALSKIQFVDYRVQDKTASIRLARALGSLPAIVALPDPLPTPPEVPISGLGRIKERIEGNARLTLDEQASLVLELKGFYQKADTATTAQDLFERLRGRSDLFASIDREIGSILDANQPVNKPAPGVSKPAPSPYTSPKIQLPTLSVGDRVRSWLWNYLWAALGAFVLIAPLSTLDRYYADKTTNHGLIALIMAFGLLLARTLPIWLPQRFNRRLFGLGTILVFLIGLAFAEVTSHYAGIYFGNSYAIVVAFPAIPLVLGFVLGATWLRHRLRLRIVVGTLGGCGLYASLIAASSYGLSFPFVERTSPIWDNLYIYYVDNAYVVWMIIGAVALACSVLVYWPELAQNRVTEVEK